MNNDSNHTEVWIIDSVWSWASVPRSNQHCTTLGIGDHRWRWWGSAFISPQAVTRRSLARGDRRYPGCCPAAGPAAGVDFKAILKGIRPSYFQSRSYVQVVDEMLRLWRSLASNPRSSPRRLIRRNGNDQRVTGLWITASYETDGWFENKIGRLNWNWSERGALISSGCLLCLLEASFRCQMTCRIT